MKGGDVKGGETNGDGQPGSLEGPRPLRSGHDLSRFRSGQPTLDDWLKNRALSGEASGAARTRVVCFKGSDRVVAYDCLCAGSVARADAPGAVRRNMPDPVPAVLLGRLAVDLDFQGAGLGGGLIRDAAGLTLRVAEGVGVRALLVHALSDAAVAFYRRYGFKPAPADPHVLMLLLPAARTIAGE